MTRIVNGEYVHVPIADLMEWPGNPRHGDIDGIMRSIVENGWSGALLVQASTSLVVAGNHRLAAARRLGMDDVPVIWLDIDDETAARFLLADNRAPALAHVDNPGLLSILNELSEADLAATLYTLTDREALNAAIASATAPTPLNNATLTPSATERREQREAADVRAIVVPLAADDYEEAMATLTAIRRETGEDNPTIILRLLVDAEANL